MIRAMTAADRMVSSVREQAGQSGNSGKIIILPAAAKSIRSCSTHLELEAFNIKQKISMDGRSRRAAKNLCRCGGSFSSSGKKTPTSKVGDELRPLYYMTTICINVIM